MFNLQRFVHSFTSFVGELQKTDDPRREHGDRVYSGPAPKIGAVTNERTPFPVLLVRHLSTSLSDSVTNSESHFPGSIKPKTIADGYRGISMPEVSLNVESSPTIDFGPERWKEDFECETEESFSYERGKENRHRIFIPKNINGKSNTLGNFIDLLSKLPCPVQVVVHIDEEDRLVKNDDPTRKNFDLLSRGLRDSYWCEFAKGRTVKVIHPDTHPDHPTVRELVTLYAARTLVEKKEFNRPPLWANEKLMNGKRVWVHVDKSVIHIKSDEPHSTFKGCLINRYFGEGWVG